MNDFLYWLSRTALACGWCVVAALAFRRRDEGRWWLGCAGAAVLFASMRAFPWNYLLLEAARAGLRAAGVYDDRLWFKILLAVLLAAALLLLVRAGRRARAGRSAVACGAALLLQGTLLGIETCSLDDAMPRWLVTQPGRYLYEGTAVAIALLAARARPQPCC